MSDGERVVRPPPSAGGGGQLWPAGLCHNARGLAANQAALWGWGAEQPMFTLKTKKNLKNNKAVQLSCVPSHRHLLVKDRAGAFPGLGNYVLPALRGTHRPPEPE